MDWETVDWAALERLRKRFLAGGAAAGPYWESRDALASYDFTFGRRIGWKWAAVLEQARALGWAPPARRLVDWGCGTAIAARSMVAHFGAEAFDEIVLWDHSPLATDFARERLLARAPDLAVRIADPAAEPDGAFVLTVSHVLNELDPPGREALLGLASRAAAVLWLEPGTHADARALIDARDELRKHLRCWLPCPHDGACGLHAPDNARHWCHHFARPPTEAFTEGGWALFAARLGIDLRALPHAHLVLDRRARAAPAGEVRLIGRPREGAGAMRLLRCAPGGVAEVGLRRCDAGALWKALGKERHAGRFVWSEDEAGRIRGDPPPREAG